MGTREARQQQVPRLERSATDGAGRARDDGPTADGSATAAGGARVHIPSVYCTL
jgi:hypothetical protein